jgi:hypothetical protein
MLPGLPNAEEVIDEAKACGWHHSRGRNVLTKDGQPAVILQPIPEDSWYSHELACHYARRLGLEIAPPPKLPEETTSK